MKVLLLSTLLAAMFHQIKSGRGEKRLFYDLFERDQYNPLVRPVVNESDAVIVKFDISLQQIIDVDEKEQMLVTSIWLNLVWRDSFLVWEPTDYENVTSIRVPANRIWKPDILLYNSADAAFDTTYKSNVVVQNSGETKYVPPGLFKSTCPIDITWFPFDEQGCKLKFGSWTYDGFQIDLQLERPHGDSTTFIRNGEWTLLGIPALRHVNTYTCCGDTPFYDINFTIRLRRRKMYYIFNIVMPGFILSALTLLSYAIPAPCGEKVSFGIPAKRNVLLYPCCPEPYYDTTFVIKIRRRKLYFLFNIVAPAFVIALLTLLSYAIPAGAGEKLSFCVTILLSLTVFSLLVAEAMPPTSDALPLIGMYFTCVMLMCSLSVVFTVLVLNVYHRTADTHKMPVWVKKGVCVWLAWILRMNRPGKKFDRRKFLHRLRLNNAFKHLNYENTDVAGSRSLMANVLDINDDYRSECGADPLAEQARSPTPAKCMPAANADDYYMRLEDFYADPNSLQEPPPPLPPPLSGLSDSGYLRWYTELSQQMNEVLNEVRFLAERMREKDASDEIVSDWQFASCVIDRLFLIIFVTFTLVSTFGILLSAPNVFN